MGDRANSYPRRYFLKSAIAGATGLGALALAGRGPKQRRAAAAEFQKPGNHHLAWVWQFDHGTDGTIEKVRSHLAFYGVGIILKTHDGTNWMARYDRNPTAVTGGAKVRELASFFETGGVPFHAWCVVKGLDPIREAHMCAEVLANGARSMVLDLEPSDGGSFWQGTPEAARAFGAELRRLHPHAWISVAPDPRPWQVEQVPMREFAAFSNEIAPQTYWPTFNSSANHRLLRERGFHVGPEGVTPELILDVAKAVFGEYWMPIRPVGSGNADPGSWHRFVDHARRLDMWAVSVWRFGTANPVVFDVLNEKKPLPNEFYGNDWDFLYKSQPPSDNFASPPPPAANLTPAPELPVAGALGGAKEATSPRQGIEDLDRAPAREGKASPQPARRFRSFWANPTGATR
ncbi:MAG TPA: hypothetical protein VNN10_09705 [Dehalococcoidia bacterium]|nr:hypothetical protein [Dehalococcoidia bacterium]